MTDQSAWPKGRPLRLEGVTVRRGAAVILDRLDLSF
jgi:putative ABC transport system ATP-binding protein